MAYYWLDSFPKDKVENLADLCSRELNMQDSSCELPNRQWLSDNKVCLVRYTPKEDFPLLVQCWSSCNYRTPEVKDFLRRIAEMANIKQFYDGAGDRDMKPVDVAVLR
ncbi:hypothetical protein FJZ19_01640 [Candidatus Pacearchaeota archaeon]|nr:hypothetical protein [Candidatus Pacearchaeota archaeon]